MKLCFGDKMTAAFNLSELSQVEKLQLLEQLWAELEHSELVSPAWHCDVLQDTQKLMATQQVKFVDWQEAKKRLRQQN